MFSEKVAKPSFDLPRSSRFQWLQRVLVGAGFLAAGIWVVSQPSSGWMSGIRFGYLKNSVGPPIIQPDGSSLNEPWSKVGYPIDPLRSRVCDLQVTSLKHHDMTRQSSIAVADSLRRSVLM